MKSFWILHSVTLLQHTKGKMLILKTEAYINVMISWEIQSVIVSTGQWTQHIPDPWSSASCKPFWGVFLLAYMKYNLLKPSLRLQPALLAITLSHKCVSHLRGNDITKAESLQGHMTKAWWWPEALTAAVKEPRKEQMLRCAPDLICRRSFCLSVFMIGC